jgi:hypothetical protein
MPLELHPISTSEWWILWWQEAIILKELFNMHKKGKILKKKSKIGRSCSRQWTNSGQLQVNLFLFRKLDYDSANGDVKSIGKSIQRSNDGVTTQISNDARNVMDESTIAFETSIKYDAYSIRKY